ncbi:MAG: hypothetical protein Kow0029_19690 [Candidatus Rifleibacteriota bacterium]
MRKKIMPKPVLLWFTICLFLAGVPAIILFSAIQRHLNLEEEIHRQTLHSYLMQALVQAEQSINQEAFWCMFFQKKHKEFVNADSSAAEIEKWMRKTRARFDNAFDYLHWDTEGNIVDITFETEYSAEDWKEVFKTLCFHYPRSSMINYSRKFKPNVEVTKKVLGEQYIPEIFSYNYDPQSYSLAWTDSTLKRPLYFTLFTNSAGYLIGIKPSSLKNRDGLKFFIRNFSLTHGVEMGFFSPEDIDGTLKTTFKIDNKPQLIAYLSSCEKNSMTLLETEKSYLYYGYLSAELRLFIKADKLRTISEVNFYSMLGAVLFLVVLSPVFVYTWKTIVLELPGNISIRWKLAFLFLFASGIPLLALAIVAQENYLHKRSELMNYAQQQTTQMLLSFDKRFKTFSTATGLKMQNFFNSLSDEVRSNASPEQINQMIQSFMKTVYTDTFFLIASESKALISYAGAFVLKGSLENSEFDMSKSKPLLKLSNIIKSDINTANIVGKKLLGDLNGNPLPLATISKLEIVAETLMQKPFNEIIHSVISNFNSLSIWGFGHIKDYGFSQLIPSYDKNKYDYVGLAFWRPHHLHKYFLEKTLAYASRNASNIKFIAVRDDDSLTLPEDFIPSDEFAAFVKTLSDRPNENLQFIKFDGRTYIAVGFKAHEVFTFKLAGLFPLDEIEKKIDAQRIELMLFGAFCLLFSFGLAQLLFRSFLKPIEALQNGAFAIEMRDFKHRIQIDNKDEFGQIAGIFNNVMVGFEELEVAKIVQESLLPTSDFAQGNFKIYGKSVAMSELGGDYFDFFPVDEHSFAILMGDVAGHGVGAAVIMAMAKAGVLNSTDILDQPAEMLLRLHRMILASKSARQRKIMTFQYMFISSELSRGIYSNAGGCSPMLVKNNGQIIQEINLPGPALGAFKKARFSDFSFEFSHGDALVFYTDGIVETRNADGDAIGFEGFKNMLREGYDIDPAVFYNKVFANYTSHLGEQEAQDDITLLILICDMNGNNKEIQE